MSGPANGVSSDGVGYGRPPKACRYKPGVSGNPKGRPRKKSPPEISWDALGVSDLFLATLGQEVNGIERGQSFTVKCLGAVMQTMAASALKGNVQAGRTLLKFSLDLEKQQAEARAALLISALEAQMSLDRHLVAWRAAGRDEGELMVHPRDIEIDWSTGEVRLYVALTREQRDARTELVGLLNEAMAAILVTLAVAAEDGDDGILKIVRDAAHAQIEHINAYLPSRFRRSPPGEDESDFAKAALEPISEVAREASKRWSRRMLPHLKTIFASNKL